MKKRNLILLGILAPIIYFGASIIGGFSNVGYSHIEDSVSDLLVKGMNNLILLDTLMLVSSMATIIGCLSIFLYFRKRVTFPVNLGVLLIGFTGFSTIMSSYVFRLEESTGSMTFSTIMHIVFVACAAILVVIGAILIAFFIGKTFEWKGFKTYTIISIMILLVGGAVTPIVMSSGVRIIGLVERVSVIAYQQWFVAMTIKFYTFSDKLPIKN